MTMTIEHDSKFEPWPAEPDPINTAICPLIAAVFELTADGSAERKAALCEVLTAAEKVRAAMRLKPRLN
jgi:hypothetical protein